MILVEPYLEQAATWPQSGCHILAQFDETTIVVYQAYRSAIGHFAARHGYFGGEFKLDRMSWIKPGFLWMMYRSGWGTKPGQEVILAVRLKREAFDLVLRNAVHSSFVPQVYRDKEAWQRQLAQSSVRLQWDPDHDPSGRSLTRRAVQLGLRGEMLERYAKDWTVEIEDISSFVRGQRGYAASSDYKRLVTPRERVYPVSGVEVRQRLGLSGEG